MELSEEEVREYAEKIKTLVEADQKELAIDLVCSLNAPKLFAELLRGCSISPWPTCKINLSSWLKDDRHFFLILIGHCPEEAEIAASLRRENVTRLELSSCKSRTNLDGFSGFTNLEFLYLDTCETLANLDELSGLTKLEKLILPGCSSLTDLEGLSGLTNLK